MLTLDHPSLESFEPLIDGLYKSAFENAQQGLASAGLQPGDEWHTEAGRMFKAVCLPSFKKTQDAIGANVIDLEKRIVSLKKEQVEARVKKDFPTVNELKQLREVLQNRQLVLRRLMDGMLWVLILPKLWLLRQLWLDGEIRPIDVSVIEPLLETVAREHLKPGETFLLICDLTTFAQLGDLIVAQWKPERNAMKIVVAELKTGRMNVLLHKLLHDPEKPDLDSAISKISHELVAKAEKRSQMERHLMKQAGRMIKQENRLKNFDRVITTDEGVNPISGQKLKMVGGTHAAKDYRDQIQALVARAKLDGSSGATLDGCLYLFATVNENQAPSREGLKIAHAFYHVRCDNSCRLGGSESEKEEEFAAIVNSPKAVNLMNFGMHNNLALPPLLWYPRGLMLDVLMGRIKVFAQFDHEKFFKLASKFQLKMSFVKGREAEWIKSKKIS